ncbi:tigger transposable element-derived protein 1-like [Anastrepha ludens]|uniref:tigger transposable element-derived protein 1-like n=1 Tax=Anastrepha ludens TaxID=28586 RepID=UPI0023B0E463|nr:tigger transposable element-derived protein 1-like [Anastrepha ludens]
MKGVDFSTLPVDWMANKKACVKTTVFTEWFVKYFVPETRKYMNEKGLEFKVLLLVSNAPGHRQLEHENVQVMFLLPNTTSLIQPLDQGIIATFITYYIKRTFQYILDALDKDNLPTVIDAWKKFSIKDCVKHAALALSYGLLFDDIVELMIDKVLSEEEILHFASQNADSIERRDSEDPVILTSNLIQKGLQIANKLGHHFITNDPNVEGAAKFQRELNSCMARYKKL